MNRFIKGLLTFALRNKILVIALAVITLIGGVYSFRNVRIEAYPDVTNTQVTIITQWPGRSAEEIERFVTYPIEIAMNSVPKKIAVRSTTLFGLSVVKVMFEDDVDYDYGRVQVNNMLMDVDLPDGVDPEVEPPYGPTGEIFRYTLSSKTRSIRELTTIQNWVVDRAFHSVSGVADVNAFGGEVRIFEVSVNPKKLAEFNITPLDVYQAVQRSNLNVGGDVISAHEQAFVVRGIGLLTSIDDIENIIISKINGVPILVKTVATVKESAAPRLGTVGRDRQNDVMEGIVVMRKGENPSEVIDRLEAKIQELNERVLPADVKINTFYNRKTLIHYCIDTVMHNLVEGILLVIFIVSLFLFDWRATLITALIIPLSLAFAFICLKIKGMSANLLSIGAIDFGIIIDGTVVMVEGLFVAYAHRAEQLGMGRFNNILKGGIVRRTGLEMARAIFFAKLVIMTCLIPIFSFEKIEGKLFSPLAFTLGFALLGSLLFSLTLVPVLFSLLMHKNVREKHNPVVHAFQSGAMRMFDAAFHNKKISVAVALVAISGGIFSATFLGTEFLPQLNEGAVYVRANMPSSISLPDAVKYSNAMRGIFDSFSEVKSVISQTGRPNDGTDATGFYNIEFHVDLYPKEEWKEKITKPQLIDRMQRRLGMFPGITFNFSQPIMDNVEEAVSGVKGSIAVKIFGNDFGTLEQKATQLFGILRKVRGIQDLGIIKNVGQPEMRVELDERKMARYGIAMADAQAVVEMAIGGKAASQFYEGERKFDIRVRYQPEFRNNEARLGDLKVPTLSGNKIPISEIATIRKITGPLLIFRDGTKRYIAVKFSVRGRDMGGTIAEAQQKVGAVMRLPKNYNMTWTGDFENQQRAEARLETVVPISLTIIFIILLSVFGNAKDAVMVMSNVLFAVIGGIAALLLSHTNFSISAGIGFIALSGICIQDGVIIRNVFKKNFIEHRMPLDTAIKEGVRSRIRPILMTALMGMLGLMPAALSTGIGSEAQRPLAIVVIGGLVTTTILSIVVDPILFELAYKNSKRFAVRNSQAE
jgi:cobalt-zinc-cadmium resistance protein CzcA